MLANGISAMRILLAPAALVSIHRDGQGLGPLSLALLLTAGLSDLLDGLAARRLGQTSRLGRVLDPVADKVFVGALCAGLALWRHFPVWLLVLQLARDAAIVVSGAFLLRSRSLVLSPSRTGKAATWAMGLTILAHALSLGGPLPAALAAAAAALLLWSAGGYALDLARTLRSTP